MEGVKLSAKCLKTQSAGILNDKSAFSPIVDIFKK